MEFIAGCHGSLMPTFQSNHKMPAELFRYVGSVRPQLKRLRIHMQWFDSDQMIREIAMENRQNDEDA